MIKRILFYFRLFRPFLFLSLFIALASASGSYLEIFRKFSPFSAFLLAILIFLVLLALGIAKIQWNRKRSLAKFNSYIPETDDEFCSFFPESQKEIALAFRNQFAENNKLDPRQVRHDMPMLIPRWTFDTTMMANNLVLYFQTLPREKEKSSGTSTYCPFESLGLTSGSPWFMKQFRRCFAINPCPFIYFLDFFTKITERTSQVFEEFRNLQEGPPKNQCDPQHNNQITFHINGIILGLIVLLPMFGPWMLMKNLTDMSATPTSTVSDMGYFFIALLTVIAIALLCFVLPLRFFWNRIWNQDRTHHRKTLKKQPPQSQNEFLSHFPEPQQPLATAIQKSLARTMSVSPQYIHHDTPLTSFSDSIPNSLSSPDSPKAEILLKRAQRAATAPTLKKAAAAAYEHCRYLSKFSFSQRYTSAWWDHNLRRLAGSETTVQTLVHVVTYIEQQLGQALEGLDLTPPTDDNRLAKGRAGE